MIVEGSCMLNGNKASASGKGPESLGMGVVLVFRPQQGANQCQI